MSLAPSDPPEVAEQLWAGLQGELAWDVGANYGQSLLHLRKCFAEIWSFEPAEESFAVLQREWSADPRVRLYQVAVSDHEGTLETSVRAQSIAKGELVIVADMPEQEWNLPAWAALPWGPETSRRSVQCITLDGLLAREGLVPDLVKVDTEGHEAQVLTGAHDLLATGKPDWLVECHDSDYGDACSEALAEAGYIPEVIRHPHYTPQGRMWHNHFWLKAKGKR